MHISTPNWREVFETVCMAANLAVGSAGGRRLVEALTASTCQGVDL